MHVQRMQKALVQMNLQLPSVVSTITGETGLRKPRGCAARLALLGGESILRV